MYSCTSTRSYTCACGIVQVATANIPKTAILSRPPPSSPHSLTPLAHAIWTQIFAVDSRPSTVFTNWVISSQSSVNRKKNCLTVGRSWFLTFVGFAEEKWEKFRWFSLQSRGSSAAAAAVVKLHAEFIQARDTILSLSNLLIAHGIDQ